MKDTYFCVMQNEILFKQTSIAFSDEGKGSTVVLLHGFLENRCMWNQISEELQKTNRVICIDLLGHGETSCLGYLHSMELMAEAVHSVIKSLRLRRIILIGHSMGGYVSLAFAEKYPKMVKALCLMNSSAQADSIQRNELRLRANKMVQNNFVNMVRMSIANLFKPESLDQFPKEVQRVKEQALKTTVQGYIACMEGMRIRPNRVSVLHNFEKVFYLIGKFDPVIDYSSIIEEAKTVNAEYVVLEGGHMSHIENKKETIDSLRTFVRL